MGNPGKQERPHQTAMMVLQEEEGYMAGKDIIRMSWEELNGVSIVNQVVAKQYLHLLSQSVCPHQRFPSDYQTPGSNQYKSQL